MDNKPICHSNDLKEIVSKRGYHYVYLSPYPPFLNSIEEYCSKLKVSLLQKSLQKWRNGTLQSNRSRQNNFILRLFWLNRVFSFIYSFLSRKNNKLVKYRIMKQKKIFTSASQLFYLIRQNEKITVSQSQFQTGNPVLFLVTMRHQNKNPQIYKKWINYFSNIVIL